jgi:hypothetical protein
MSFAKLSEIPKKKRLKVVTEGHSGPAGTVGVITTEPIGDIQKFYVVDDEAKRGEAKQDEAKRETKPEKPPEK